MRPLPKFLRALAMPVLAGCGFLMAVTGAWAQSGTANPKDLQVQRTEADTTAANEATLVYRKASKGHKSKAVDASKLVTRGPDHNDGDSGETEDAQVRYPDDLQYHQGPVVDFAQSHNIYLLPGGNCPIATCWGNPKKFLRDLGESEFIHVTDQYVGQHASDRYTVGVGASLSYTPPATPLTDNDMRAVVHAVASLIGDAGYHHIYHVFLPPGQDECFDSTFTTCASNVFCAYHSSVDFKDIGHALYSVEPYANVPGCQVRPGTPNGTLVDSTNTVLSHELIETITDPDGTAWWNSRDNGSYGQEIGDECQFLLPTFFSDPAIISVEGSKYALQPEYSNAAHGCVALK